MIVKGHILDTKKPKLTLFTQSGGMVDFYGFGKDSITSFCTHEEDYHDSIKLRAKLMEAGFRGVGTIDEKVINQVSTIINADKI